MTSAGWQDSGKGMDGLTIRAKCDPSKGGAIDILLASVILDQVFPGAVEFASEAAGAVVPDTLQLSAGAAQQLVDDLLAAGVRPTRRPVPDALIAAKDKHVDQLFELAKLALAGG